MVSIRNRGLLLAVLLPASVAMAAEAAAPALKGDLNQDGKLSYSEFRGAQEHKLQTRFKKLDSNGDGHVDDQEKQTAKDKLREWRKRKQH